MKKRMKDVLTLMRGSLFGLLPFSVVVVTSVVLANESEPPALGRPPQRAKTKWTDEQLYGPYKGKSLKALWSARADFFKSGKVPTDSNEVQRLWQWYRAMDNADPTFRSNTPIEFYGKVLDQHGNAVSESTVDMYWGGETNQVVVQTHADGSFGLLGAKGSHLSVNVYKKRYVAGTNSKTFNNYIDWFDSRFHLPNPTNPVIIRLQKLENPEPMYVWDPVARLDVVGSIVWFDVGTGKKGAIGDIGFSVVRDEFPGNWESGYSLTIHAAEGGGIAVADEEFMFKAPETGYAPRLVMRVPPRGAVEGDFQSEQNLRVYLRTSDAKYAAINAEISQSRVASARVYCVIYFNPSGSRNLELGTDNRLDPAKVKPPKRAPAAAAKGAVIEQK